VRKRGQRESESSVQKGVFGNGLAGRAHFVDHPPKGRDGKKEKIS